MYVRWTAERQLRLSDLWNQGVPTKEIGKEFGATKNAVIGMAHKMHLPPHPSMRQRGGLSVRARRALVAIVDFKDEYGRMPSVSELAGLVEGANRGVASDACRELELHGVIWRPKTGKTHVPWQTGGYMSDAVGLVKMYRENPRKWLSSGPSKERMPVLGDRTRYRSRVVAPGDNPLKPGRHVEKLGSFVTKGHWKGAQIFVLTLEERATCSPTCKVYEWCYGNNMPLAKRLLHGGFLERKIEDQLRRMDRQGKRTRLAVLRLHVLGDFYSVGYVRFWQKMLRRYDWLRIFGYTAWPADSDIGMAVRRVYQQEPGRFMIRTSGYGDEMAAYVREHDESLPPNSFQCPEQTGNTKECGTCGACWSTLKNVVFLKH